MPPERYSVSLPGRKGVRHHRFQGSENSSDSQGTPAIAFSHVEDGRPAVDWKIGLGCAGGEAGVAADDLLLFPMSADWVCHSRVAASLAEAYLRTTKFAVEERHPIPRNFTSRTRAHRFKDRLRSCIMESVFEGRYVIRPPLASLHFLQQVVKSSLERSEARLQ